MSTPHRVHRCETLRVGDLSAHTRCRLAPPLVDIVQTWFCKSDREFIADRVIFRDPDAVLRVFYGADDEILGCATVEIAELDGREGRQAVFDAGVYLRPGTRGGDLDAVRLGLKVALQYKLEKPRTPMCFVGAVATPASYRFLSGICRTIHPRRGLRTPAHIEALMRQVSEHRGLIEVGTDPLRVTLPEPAPLADPQRLSRSKRLLNDPDARWFEVENPEFAVGHWMMAYIPLDLVNLTGTAMNFVRRRWLPSLVARLGRR